MADPCSAAITQHTDAVAHAEGFPRIHFLSDGKRATAIDADLNFNTLARAHRLLCMRARHGTKSGTTDGCQGFTRAATDLISKNAASYAAKNRPSGGAAFDFYVADRGDSALLHRLSLSGLIARIGVACEALLGAGNAEER